MIQLFWCGPLRCELHPRGRRTNRVAGPSLMHYHHLRHPWRKTLAVNSKSRRLHQIRKGTMDTHTSICLRRDASAY